jgi:hypothetical protein
VTADIPVADADIDIQVIIISSLGVELLAPMETVNNDADNGADLQFAIEASVDSNRFVIFLTILKPIQDLAYEFKDETICTKM